MSDTAPTGAAARVERCARLDIPVHNAGTRIPGTALHSTAEEWDPMIPLNVAAPLHVAHAAQPHLPGSSVHDLTESGRNGFPEGLRRDPALRQAGGIEPPRPAHIADAIGCAATRERRMAVREMLVRAGDRTW